jgi:hypothetical protein
MIRGTTAPFTFKLPILGSEVAEVEIKFWQRNNYGTPEAPLPITLDKESCVIVNDSYEMGIELSPEQTLRFSDKRKASVQGFITATNGVKYGIKEQIITVYPRYSGTPTDLPDTDSNGFIILDGNNVR